MNVEAIPLELRERPQWVLWKTKRRDGKPTKVPYRASKPTARASSTDSATWATFEAALDASDQADGIGFVFAADDPYVGVDLDVLDADATAIVSVLSSYTERSISGRGAHVIVRGSLNGHRRRRKGPVEIYAEGRYFVVTGDHVQGTPATIQDRQTELEEVLERAFGKQPESPATAATRPVAPLDVDDQELLERARAARNGAAFEQLWAGETIGYDSHSEADLALAGRLAYWCGPDAGRIDRLFRRSGLYREKWDTRRGETTYGEQTIARALEGRVEFFDWARVSSPRVGGDAKSEPEPTLRDEPEPTLVDAPTASAQTEAEDEARPILFVTLREFLELDFPPAESLVGHVRGGTNLLPRFGWVMPWGREGSSKTTLLVDLLFHAAAAAQWLRYPIARPLRIVAIVNEGVPGGFQDKLAEKLELWDGAEGPLDGLAVYASPWGEFTFRDERMLAHLRDFAADFDADYVACDPLHTLGPTGSGTPEETEEFKHVLRRLGVWEWIGILTAHHSNKAGMVSGDWARHPDTVLHVEKDGRLPRSKLTVQKARPADPAELGNPLLLEWLVETKSYRLVEADPEKTGDANRERVLEAVLEGVRSAGEVGERTGLSAKTVKRHFRDLEKAELVRLEEGPNRMILASPSAVGQEDEGEEPTLAEEPGWE